MTAIECMPDQIPSVHLTAPFLLVFTPDGLMGVTAGSVRKLSWMSDGCQTVSLGNAGWKKAAHHVSSRGLFTSE